MTAVERVAREAVRVRLVGVQEPVMLDLLAYEAQKAVRAIRKAKLFGSLGEYAQLLPMGWRAEWMNHSGSRWDDALLYAVPAQYAGPLKPTYQVPGLFDAAADMAGM